MKESSFNKESLENTLKEYFGFTTFRKHQLEIIKNCLDGEDQFVCMATGSGKSICFQIPSIHTKKKTLIISPLIALMNDQIQKLISNGIPAATINSETNQTEMKKILSLDSNWLLLYVTPERIYKDEGFINHLKEIHNVTPFCCFAVDEAHCISQWGLDFRVSYSKISILRDSIPQVPIMALTATATENAKKDIIQNLKLNNPKIVLSSFNRPNLFYTIKKKKEYQHVLKILSKKCSSTIIYCRLIDDTKKMANFLSENGIKSVTYHSKMTIEERKKSHQQFMKDEVQTLCASKNFLSFFLKFNILSFLSNRLWNGN